MLWIGAAFYYALNQASLANFSVAKNHDIELEFRIKLVVKSALYFIPLNTSPMLFIGEKSVIDCCDGRLLLGLLLAGIGIMSNL